MSRKMYTNCKSFIRKCKTEAGRLANLYVFLIIRLSKKNGVNLRESILIDNHLSSFVTSNQYAKISLMTEGQYLRARRNIYGLSLRSVYMPAAKTILSVYKSVFVGSVRNPLLAIFSKLRIRKVRTSSIVHAGIFVGMNYKFISSADKKQSQDNYYDAITKQANDAIKVYSQLAMCKQKSASKTGILISCFYPEKFIDCFLDNLVKLEDRVSLIPIFINAGMINSTEELIKKTVSEYYPEFLFLNRPGSRIYTAWNEGIKAIGSNVEYFTNFNVDDRRHPLAFSVMKNYLDNFSSKAVVTTDYLYFFEQLSNIRDLYNHNSYNSTMIPIINSRTLVNKNFPHSGPMWRRALHEDTSVGLFDEQYISAGDAEFWYRVSRNRSSSFGTISIPLNLYYQNPNGISTKPNTIGAKEHKLASRIHYAHIKSSIYRNLCPDYVEDFVEPCKPEELQIHALAKKLESLK